MTGNSIIWEMVSWPTYPFSLFHLTDVDECAANMDHCNRNLSGCINTEGGYVCKCLEGYMGDGLHCEGMGVHEDCAASGDWRGRNEQETLVVIWASSASSCGAVLWPCWLVLVLFEESDKGVDPSSGSPRQSALIISCFVILSFLSELWQPQQLIIMQSL